MAKKGVTKDKPSRAEEILFVLSLRSDFQSDVNAARAKYSPEGILELMQKYKIPSQLYESVRDYIQTNSTQSRAKRVNEVALIEQWATFDDRAEQEPLENMYRVRGEPYVKLFLLSGGSKSDIHDFIDKKWPKIEEMFSMQGADTHKRIRVRNHKERDRLVMELARKPKEELQELASSQSTYKDILINMILERVYGYKKPPSEGYIRKLIAEYNKRD